MKNLQQIKQKGFTLIELLLVIAIIGVLTSFLLVNFIGTKARARDAQRKSDLRQLQSALELYRADVGTYPAAPLAACGTALTSGGTTYIQKIPCDPSTKASYIYTTTGTTYTLTACLENTNDSQKDSTNNAACTAGTASYTVNNP
ncbi:MAG TPA: prepilin-type N-terminal cleavage/methylation domain-containing protein [Candidatus Saccharimonadales bacterium]|nr:prepilin-type N-terminal cleavage/methylation domain-containing protein [Candidatus Saccharimonadales bacterium]